MGTKNPAAAAPTSAQAAWVSVLGKVIDEIEAWAEASSWPVSRKPKTISEEHIGTYAAPVLNIKPPGGWVVVEPIGQEVLGCDGRIDIYSFPTLHRVLLVREHGGWVLRTESGLLLHQKWGRKAFVNLVGDLTAA
ncbi:MAG: hypothetical protein NTU94_05880 [Planctomycetota bacterium]|nr:hypothetical protein [Planctomycetota bacterium]